MFGEFHEGVSSMHETVGETEVYTSLHMDHPIGLNSSFPGPEKQHSVES